MLCNVLSFQMLSSRCRLIDCKMHGYVEMTFTQLKGQTDSRILTMFEGIVWNFATFMNFHFVQYDSSSRLPQMLQLRRIFELAVDIFWKHSTRPQWRHFTDYMSTLINFSVHWARSTVFQYVCLLIYICVIMKYWKCFIFSFKSNTLSLDSCFRFAALSIWLPGCGGSEWEQTEREREGGRDQSEKEKWRKTGGWEDLVCTF